MSCQYSSPAFCAMRSSDGTVGNKTKRIPVVLKSFFEHEVPNVTIIGDAGIGKTALVNALTSSNGIFGNKIKRINRPSEFDSHEEDKSYFKESMRFFNRKVGKKMTRISGLYSKDDWNLDDKDVIWMEHSALNNPGNEWEFHVRYRQRGHSGHTKQWRYITELYPEAGVKINHNIIEVTIPLPNENHEFAVFGKPGIGDKKRMQVGLFGERPMKGNNILIHVILFDDTMMAVENVCEEEESKGRQLLTTLAGLIVSNNDKDIMIEVNGLETGYDFDGSNVKTIKSKDAWNTPENSTDYPDCLFEISCKDKATTLFKCEIIAKQETDTAEAEIFTRFDQKYGAPVTGHSVTEQPEEQLDISWSNLVGVYLYQMTVFLACCATDFDQSAAKENSFTASASSMMIVTRHL